MYARVSTFEGLSPQDFDAAVDQARSKVLPAARQIDGFKGLISLADRASGKSIGITFWESEAAMKASADAANAIRSESVANTGERIVAVDQYEVVIDERG